MLKTTQRKHALLSEAAKGFSCFSQGKRPKGFNQEKYDVSKLQDGVYVVCVSINGEVITNKVIKR